MTEEEKLDWLMTKIVNIIMDDRDGGTTTFWFTDGTTAKFQNDAVKNAIKNGKISKENNVMVEFK